MATTDSSLASSRKPISAHSSTILSMATAFPAYRLKKKDREPQFILEENEAAIGKRGNEWRIRQRGRIGSAETTVNAVGAYDPIDQSRYCAPHNGIMIQGAPVGSPGRFRRTVSMTYVGAPAAAFMGDLWGLMPLMPCGHACGDVQFV